MNIINTLRKLWQEHVQWTRSFIISTVSNLDDLSYVTQRLLENPQDFADVLRNFYGYEQSQEFESLLKEHLLIAAKLVNDAKAGNTKSADADRIKWYKNADDIVQLLSEMNPYINKKEWQNLLYNHLKLTENEAVYRLTKQYANDIANYDEIENQALDMADQMAADIIRQFNVK